MNNAIKYVSIILLMCGLFNDALIKSTKKKQHNELEHMRNEESVL